MPVSSKVSRTAAWQMLPPPLHVPRRKAELAGGVDVAGPPQQQDPASATKDDVDVDDAGKPVGPRAFGWFSGEGVEHGNSCLVGACGGGSVGNG